MNKFKFVSVLALLLGISLFFSCKKKSEFKQEDGSTAEEVSEMQSSADAGIDDANRAVNDVGGIAGRSLEDLQSLQSIMAICGGTADTTQRDQGIVTVTFDGTTPCNGRIRSGTIKATLIGFSTGTRWKDANAVLQLDFTAYKVVRASDKKSWTFDGRTTNTNVSGGNLVLMWLKLQPNVVNKVEGTDLKVTFDDGKTGTFNISRQYTHTYDHTAKVHTIKGEGLGSHNGISQLENWGVNRDGLAFTNKVVEPIVVNTSCALNKPIAGKFELAVEEKDFTLITTANVDQDGNPVSACGYGYKVEWTYKGKTKHKIIAYK